MDTARRDKLEVMFDRVLGLPPDEREQFLKETETADPAFYAELESLLNAANEAPRLFNHLAQEAPAVNISLARALADPHHLIDQTVSHYRVLEPLGGGGMGLVYKAEDVHLKRTVALKFLPPEWSRDAKARNRFMQEAQAASALDHPNVCTVHEVEAMDDGRLFIAMAYCDGETLQHTIERGPLAVPLVLDYALQAAQGLRTAHEHGIVHRDIKPVNLMVTGEGVLKILDFGIAKVAGAHLTSAGVVMGTLAYMSPEQVRGEEVDHRTDIWSLGVVLYAMLTGSTPFAGAYDQALRYAILYEEPKPASSLRGDIPQGLADIVDRCLRKDRAGRFASAAEVYEALEAVRRGTNIATRRLLPERIRTARTLLRPAPLLSMAAFIVLVIAGLLPTSRATVVDILGLAGTPIEKHLAVLPFTNIGGDPANQVFTDGLVETLTSKLTQLEQFEGTLWVVPSSEVRRYDLTSPGEAQKAFGANLVVTGSVQRDAEMVRLTLNLVDTKTLRQLESRVIDDRITEASVLQDEVVFALTELLEMELQPEARRMLTAGGTAVPGAYDYYVQGLGYLQRYEKVENIDFAVDLFRRAIQGDGEYAEAYAGLAEAYWRKYENTRDVQLVETAERYANRAVALDSTLAPVHVTLGLILGGRGRYTEAIQAYQRALAYDPSSAAAYRGLAEAYEASGDIDAAEATFFRAIELRKDYWAGYHELGSFYYRQGRYDEAYEQYERVRDLTPDNYVVYIDLGAAYFYLGRYDDAEELFKRSLAIRPTLHAYMNLATLYYHSKHDYAAAARTYEKALALSEGNHEAWAYVGYAYYWAPGEREKAYPAFRRAIALAEEQLDVTLQDPMLFASLGGYHAMLGNREDALRYMSRAIDLEPKDWPPLITLGSTYEFLGDRDRALTWVERALKAGYPAQYVASDPILQALSKDPRFENMLLDEETTPP
jgi:serine/threonine-protein kinase